MLRTIYQSDMFTFRALCCSCTIFASAVVLTGAVRGAEPFETFLETHCLSCHGPEKEKGDLRIDELSRDFALGEDTHHSVSYTHLTLPTNREV